MNANKLAFIASEAGRIILESGGETYRVEDTINRICLSYGFSLSDSFVTATGIMICVSDTSNNTASIIKRVHTRTVNLEKICLVNNFSRNISKHNYSEEEAIQILRNIDESKRYGTLPTILFSALAASTFTLIFGGNTGDAISAFFIGLIIESMVSYLNKLELNFFFINIIGGAMAALFACLLVKINIAFNLDKTIIGSIMLLVPGLAITNAIRDTIAGDLLAGITRAAEAFLTAVGIAVGSGFILKIWISIFGGIG
ncbi:threonine/serine exporter family protein [Clostridium sp. 19966]|uniref:threonine/serine exporter family protein n=1 Tax=Clostridium sp. 19966 TaxID=2768166 RepID=UPI0028DEF41D|nr:threonine/serine exporter family protein [Clostridium sp. 19966]MDT8716252.1 threonine/serine exporter family protein [Clostridium sp. 19966]